MAKKKEFSFRAPIKHAFAELTALGYFAKERFSCCQGCGFNAIPDDVEKIVFYHDQDLDDLKESGGCYISWAGDGKEIVGVLEKHGLVVEWNGKSSTRIHMQLQNKDVATREMISGKTKY